MADGFNIQVQREHYNKNYDDLPRFISYFHQIESVINTKSKTVLEVGIGNKTVTNYFKMNTPQLAAVGMDKKTS